MKGIKEIKAIPIYRDEPQIKADKSGFWALGSGKSKVKSWIPAFQSVRKHPKGVIPPWREARIHYISMIKYLQIPDFAGMTAPGRF